MRPAGFNPLRRARASRGEPLAADRTARVPHADEC